MNVRNSICGIASIDRHHDGRPPDWSEVPASQAFHHQGYPGFYPGLWYHRHCWIWTDEGGWVLDGSC